jgi:hypothetical protein
MREIVHSKSMGDARYLGYRRRSINIDVTSCFILVQAGQCGNQIGAKVCDQ